MVVEIGRVDQDDQDQALRLNEQMPFETRDCFPGVEAALSASHGTGCDRLALNDRGAKFASCWACACLCKTVMARTQVPSSFRFRKAWDTVFPLETSWGIGLHEQPVRNRYKMPLMISRRSIGSRGDQAPGSGIHGASMAHPASATSEGYSFRAC